MIIILFTPLTGYAATCTGSFPCNACKNCHYCKHCAKNGGKCGVCALYDAPRGIHEFSIRRISDTSPVDRDREILRGFNAAVFATRNTDRPSEWQLKLNQALMVGARNGTNSRWFVLGAHFGFSFQVEQYELARSKTGLRQLQVEAIRARLLYEQGKRVLNMTDADVLAALPISRAAFSSWKASAATTDKDDTVASDADLIRI